MYGDNLESALERLGKFVVSFALLPPISVELVLLLPGGDRQTRVVLRKEADLPA
jgi:hypothetical protein